MSLINTAKAVILAVIAFVLTMIHAVASTVAKPIAAAVLVGFITIAAVGTANSSFHIPDCETNSKCLLRGHLWWFSVTADSLSVLIDAGADVNAKNLSRETPLHWAAQYSAPRGISTLIQVGADVNVTDDFCLTPLNVAKLSSGGRVIKKAGGKLGFEVECL